MHRFPPAGLACLLVLAGNCSSIAAQTSQVQGNQKSTQEAGESAPLAGQPPIGRTSANEVRVSGAVELDRGEMILGNGSTVTASDQTVGIALARGGQLRLCATTSLHLSQDRSVNDPKNTALMLGLDRGALETDYTVGRYSDVLLTPDLRILIAGPGQAELRVRVNTQGDTCVDNHGAAAPYVLVSSQLEGGAYRVLPNQRVLFEHGSLREVVDREPELCGCPPEPPIAVAEANDSSKTPAYPRTAVGGRSSTPADTAFPLAESEGLAAPPPPPQQPVVAAGQAHVEVTVPLTYNAGHAERANAISEAENQNQEQKDTSVGGEQADGSREEESPKPASGALPETASSDGNVQETTPITTGPAAVSTTAPSIPPLLPKNSHSGFFHRIGHFFSHFLF